MINPGAIHHFAFLPHAKNTNDVHYLDLRSISIWRPCPSLTADEYSAGNRSGAAVLHPGRFAALRLDLPDGREKVGGEDYVLEQAPRASRLGLEGAAFVRRAAEKGLARGSFGKPTTANQAKL